MLATISTFIDTNEDKLWEKIIKPESLQFVSAPILSFETRDSSAFGDIWVLGKTYQLKLKFLNLIPLGKHDIKLIKMDRDSNTIISQESGKLSPVWNHTIHFQQFENGKLLYTDEIEIEAGWLTLFVWIFANIFYRHRQRRWKLLVGS